MSKTKSYNQIIFITTLSVYLGLVLVGASPQVLAQAAITNRFELKDQIEQKNDLDKKPDESLENYVEIVQDFYKFSSEIINERGNRNSRKEYYFDSIFYYNFTYNNKPQYSVKGTSNDLFGGKSFDYMFRLSHNFPHTFSIKFVLNPHEKIEQAIKNAQVGISLSSNENEFLLKSFFRQDSSEITKQYFTLYFDTLERKKTQNNSEIEKLIYENTTVTSADNQVFIVTRLPRGSIDSFLK